MSSPTVAALSRGPKYVRGSGGRIIGTGGDLGIGEESNSRLDYLASPELVDILTKFMLGGRLPSQVEEGTIHPMDPTADRTSYISEQPPPRDLLGSAMERGNPLAWMEQVQEPEGTPPPSLVETLARKAPQLAEQVAIIAGAAKGVKSGQPRMQWEPKFGAEKPRPASESRKPKAPVEPSPELVSALVPKVSGGESKPSGKMPKAILVPASIEGKTVDFTWETPGGKALSKPFTTETEALANRPEGFEHLDIGYQPFKSDIASVTPRTTPPKLEVVRGSGLPEEVVLRFEATEKPLSLAEVNSMFPDATIQRMGNDMVFDSQGSQKFRLTFNTPEAAAKARAAFGENVPIRDLGKSDRPVAPEPKQIEANPELVSALAGKGGSDTIRVYSGGTSAPSDFWSENPGRAASYGPNVWVVEIPRSVFEAGKAQAAKLGQPTKWDTVLPNEWVKKSSQVPSENLGVSAEPSVNIQSTPSRTLVKVGGSSGGRGETFASRSPGEYEIRENGELAGSIWPMKDPRFKGGPQVWHATIGGETRKFQSFSEAKTWALSK